MPGRDGPTTPSCSLTVHLSWGSSPVSPWHPHTTLIPPGGWTESVHIMATMASAMARALDATEEPSITTTDKAKKVESS